MRFFAIWGAARQQPLRLALASLALSSMGAATAEPRCEVRQDRGAVAHASPLGGGAAQNGDNPQLRASWWDRTANPKGQLKSRFYNIRSDLSADATRMYAERLDTIYVEYKRRLGALPQKTAEVNDVFIFASQEDYLQTLRDRFGINGMGSGGMFFTSPRGAGLAFFVEGLPQSRIFHVIQHEGFHQFAYSRFGHDLPQWLNEGLAEFFGESVIVDGTVVIGQTSERTLRTLQAAINAGKTIPFRDIITMTNDRWNANVRGGNAALQYMQAWSMVHFLVYGDGGRYQGSFERYLALLNRDVNPVDAFTQAFGTNDLDMFQSRWLEHARTARPSAFVTALERIEFLGEGMYALANKGVHPKDIDELRTALREIDFSTTIGSLGGSHGGTVTLKATDDTNFQIPDDDLAQGTPRFEFVQTKSKRNPTKKERELEEKLPLPPSIGTINLAPKNLVLRWLRSKDGTKIGFDIDVAR